MKLKLGLLLCLAFILLSFGLPKNIQKKVDKEIKDIFTIESFAFNEVIISAKIADSLPSKFNNNNLF